MQKHTFMDGSFVLHKITLDGSNARFSAWFDADGSLKDCEGIRLNGATFGPGANQRKALALYGKKG